METNTLSNQEFINLLNVLDDLVSWAYNADDVINELKNCTSDTIPIEIENAHEVLNELENYTIKNNSEGKENMQELKNFLVDESFNVLEELDEVDKARLRTLFEVADKCDLEYFLVRELKHL